MTIKEIAGLAGVSTATVSYVINGTRNVSDETKERVLKVIEKSGFRPNSIAKSLRAQNTRTIGVVVEDIRGFPVPSIVNGISEYTERHNYQILLNDLHMLESLLNRYDQITYLKDRINNVISWLLYGARVNAIIYVGMFDRDITNVLNRINNPLVVAYSLTSDDWNRCVTYDNENISAELTRYLIGMGHRRVGVITGLAHTLPSKMRMRGLLRAFSEAGLVLDSSYVQNGDWDYQSGYDCMMDFLKMENRPTAVIAMNDIMAAGAMNAVLDRGLTVPGDVSIVGFDNRGMSSYLRPRLTTVNIDLEKLGLKATETAIEMINKTNSGEHTYTLPCEIIFRDSVRSLL